MDNEESSGRSDEETANICLMAKEDQQIEHLQEEEESSSYLGGFGQWKSNGGSDEKITNIYLMIKEDQQTWHFISMSTPSP